MKTWLSWRLVGSLTAATLLIAATLLAHSGRTDKYGGHHNRKTGGYHYHNAGTVHVADNPFQDHTSCGICPTSKKPANTAPNAATVSEKEVNMALQAGLKCMGYYSGAVDGTRGKETVTAVRQYLADIGSGQH